MAFRRAEGTLEAPRALPMNHDGIHLRFAEVVGSFQVGTRGMPDLFAEAAFEVPVFSCR